jgi:protease I
MNERVVRRTGRRHGVGRLLPAVAACLPLLLGAAAGRSADGDFAAIRAAVFDYFDGINEVSRKRLERAFDPGAELKNVGADGTIVAQPIDEVIERWMAKQPAERAGEILSIDVTDGEIARVVFDYNGDYIDFLTLAKVKGQWKIIDKVFVTR